MPVDVERRARTQQRREGQEDSRTPQTASSPPPRERDREPRERSTSGSDAELSRSDGSLEAAAAVRPCVAGKPQRPADAVERAERRETLPERFLSSRDDSHRIGTREQAPAHIYLRACEEPAAEATLTDRASGGRADRFLPSQANTTRRIPANEIRMDSTRTGGAHCAIN